jgi:hypothetical protein
MAGATDTALHYFFEAKPRLTAKVGAGGVASAGATTIPHTFVGLTAGNAYVVTVNRTDATGTTKNPAAQTETFIGKVSGTNFINCVRGVEGTASAWAVDTVLEILVSATAWNKMVEGFEVAHDQTGVHKSGLTLPSPIFTGTPDLNGIELIIDADADTTLTADTDDRIDWKLGGSDRFRMGVSDFDLVTSTANIQVAGADPKRGIYVPAAGMYAAITSPAAPGQIETSTNKINAKVFDFDASTEEYAWFTIPAPSYWDLGTVTAEFHWTAASGTGDVIWGIAGLARSNDDALDTALGTAITVTDTLIAANDEHLTSDTSAITIGGTPAKDDMLFFRVYRDADAGGDTLNADARLLGVTIRFARGQYDDQ